MSDSISFAGQRMVITGAGNGIGRADALLLASRGASIVVNDSDRPAADEVVAEIKQAGGSAVASYDAVGSAASGRAVVECSLDAFGGLEAVINNAGSLRPALFEDMTEEQIGEVLAVHLLGTIYVTRAAWPHMQEQRYGRVVITSSASGLFGHPGQINYCSAKAGCFGLMKALASEGERHGILVNGLLPMAATTIGRAGPIPGLAELYRNYVTPDLGARLEAEASQSPANVAQMTAYLVSRECAVTGEAYSVCRGRFGRVFVGVSDGWLTRKDDAVTPESIRDHLPAIRALERHTVPKCLPEEVADVARRLR